MSLAWEMGARMTERAQVTGERSRGAGRWLPPSAASIALLLSTRKPLPLILFTAVELVSTPLAAAVITRSLWNWFIVPLGPKPINYAEAVGLTFTLMFLRGLRLRIPKKPLDDLWARLTDVTAHWSALAVLWGVAAIFHAVLY